MDGTKPTIRVKEIIYKYLSTIQYEGKTVDFNDVLADLIYMYEWTKDIQTPVVQKDIFEGVENLEGVNNYVEVSIEPWIYNKLVELKEKLGHPDINMVIEELMIRSIIASPRMVLSELYKKYKKDTNNTQNK